METNIPNFCFYCINKLTLSELFLLTENYFLVKNNQKNISELGKNRKEINEINNHAWK